MRSASAQKQAAARVVDSTLNKISGPFRLYMPHSIRSRVYMARFELLIMRMCKDELFLCGLVIGPWLYIIEEFYIICIRAHESGDLGGNLAYVF